MTASCVLILGLHLGGNITDGAGMVNVLNQLHCAVQITENCASACTLLLGVADVCVAPDATFLFHGPVGSSGPLPRRNFDRVSQLMADHYPPALAEWFMRTGRGTPGDRPLYQISGAQIITYGWAKDCIHG